MTLNTYRGALADQIFLDPDVGAGVGYVRMEASPGTNPDMR